MQQSSYSFGVDVVDTKVLLKSNNNDVDGEDIPLDDNEIPKSFKTTSKILDNITSFFATICGIPKQHYDNLNYKKNTLDIITKIENTNYLITVRQSLLRERIKKEIVKDKEKRNLIILKVSNKELKKLEGVSNNLTEIKLNIEQASFNLQITNLFKQINPELQNILKRFENEPIDEVLSEIKETLDDLKETDKNLNDGIREINTSNDLFSEVNDNEINKELDNLSEMSTISSPLPSSLLSSSSSSSPINRNKNDITIVTSKTKVVETQKLINEYE